MFAKFATVLAFSAGVRAVAFDGPVPTPINDLLVADIDGYSPKPTQEARALDPNNIFRRQTDDALCGYIEGDGEFPVSCSVGGCFYNTAINWFGCCTGSSLDSCNIATRCIASANVKSCLSDSSCANDEYATACTAASAPFCAQMYSIVSGNTVGHLVCAATSTRVAILASSTDGSVSSRSSAFSSGRASSTSSSTRSRTTSTEDDEQSSFAPLTVRSTATTSARTSATNVAATSSTAAAAMHTVQAMVGGLVGALAVLL